MTQASQSTLEIERHVEQSRARVSSTLRELRERMSPGQIVDEVLDYVRNSGGGEFSRNLGRSVTDNPLPLLLVGTGLAWLMSSSNGHPHAGPSMSRLASAGRDAMQTTGANDGSNAVDRIRGVAEDAGEMASEYAQGAKDIANSAKANAQNLGDQMQRTWNSLAQDQPLVLGALGIALGALLGAGLPSTTAEDRLMGDASDAVKSEVKQATHQGDGIDPTSGADEIVGNDSARRYSDGDASQAEERGSQEFRDGRS